MNAALQALSNWWDCCLSTFCPCVYLSIPLFLRRQLFLRLTFLSFLTLLTHLFNSHLLFYTPSDCLLLTVRNNRGCAHLSEWKLLQCTIWDDRNGLLEFPVGSSLTDEHQLFYPPTSLLLLLLMCFLLLSHHFFLSFFTSFFYCFSSSLTHLLLFIEVPICVIHCSCLAYLRWSLNLELCNKPRGCLIAFIFHGTTKQSPSFFLIPSTHGPVNV